MNLKLYNKAKAEFEKAFNAYAMMMFRFNGTVHDMPAFYYSEQLAEQGVQQPQTEYYLQKTLTIEKENTESETSE